MTNPTTIKHVVVQAIWNDRRAPSRVAVGDEPAKNLTKMARSMYQM
jgi:hypothetical protein